MVIIFCIKLPGELTFPHSLLKTNRGSLALQKLGLGSKNSQNCFLKKPQNSGKNSCLNSHPSLLRDGLWGFCLCCFRWLWCLFYFNLEKVGMYVYSIAIKFLEAINSQENFEALDSTSSRYHKSLGHYLI